MDAEWKVPASEEAARKWAEKWGNCQYCEEPITVAELLGNMAGPVNSWTEGLHRECLLRMVAGTVTHVRGEGVSQGGTEDCLACEEGISKREGARATFAEVRRRMDAGLDPSADCVIFDANHQRNAHLN